MKNQIFFDQISEFYDDMINFNAAINSRRKVLAGFIESHYTKAADLGCGSGLDSISLASLGLKVFAFDQSQKMIDLARLNSKEFTNQIQFYRTDLRAAKLPKSEFDFVISLGNTLANLRFIDLKKLFNKIYNSIKDGGVFVFQILNYTAIRKSKERIIRTTQNESSIFVRFYDFHHDHLDFNILKISKSDLKRTEFFTTSLYAHKEKELKGILSKAGFKKITKYGSLGKEKFSIRRSKDFVIFALK